MSAHRRDGNHQSEFAREIRDDEHEGTIPIEFGLTVIDLDAFYAVVGEASLRVNTSGRLWVWYEDPQQPEIVAVAELKQPGEAQRSWAVTRSLARRAGVPGFKICRLAEGGIEGESFAGSFSYGSTREFVLTEIKPLFDAVREAKVAA